MNDIINCGFETLAGLFVLLHCRRVLKDRAVKGASIVATSFFASWSAWNLFYYPSVGHWLSFWGGFSVFGANLLWICLMFRFRNA